MSLAASDLEALTELAKRAATSAGELIADRRPTQIERKAGLAGASQLVTDVDRLAEQTILAELNPSLRKYSLGLLTEERPDDRSRFEKEFFWCVDPLDGTLPYVEGRAGYAVSIALVSREGKPVVGVVYDPVAKDLYWARAGQGLSINGQLWQGPPQQGTSLAVYADRSFVARLDYDKLLGSLERIGESVGSSEVRVHSGAGAVMNACHVLRNPRACYLKLPKPTPGGGSLWDFAATACLFAAAGASATDMQGEELDLNRADATFMNHRGVLFATDSQLARHLRALGES